MKIDLIPIWEADLNAVKGLFDSIPPRTNGFENRGHGKSEDEFAEFVRKARNESEGIGLPEGYVPSSLFVLFVDGVPVGFSKLRYRLTPALEKHGGHIGYGLAEEFFGRGYGTIILAETLKEARKIGLKNVLLTVNDGNIPSWKVIERNGGILEKTEADSNDGQLSRFYWIEL